MTETYTVEGTRLLNNIKAIRDEINALPQWATIPQAVYDSIGIVITNIGKIRLRFAQALHDKLLTNKSILNAILANNTTNQINQATNLVNYYKTNTKMTTNNFLLNMITNPFVSPPDKHVALMTNFPKIMNMDEFLQSYNANITRRRAPAPPGGGPAPPGGGPGGTASHNKISLLKQLNQMAKAIGGEKLSVQ